MSNNLFLKYQFLREYLQNVHKIFPEDMMDDLESQDPTYFEHIQKAESEFARLETRLFGHEHSERDEKREVIPPQPEKQPQQLDFTADLSSALPPRPKQTPMQALKATTMFTPLPSIVEEGYGKQHRGIDWPHYENMLKLFALDYFVQETPTQQQEKDRKDLTMAIEQAGNAKYKKKRLTAEEIIDRDSGIYMRYGKNVIRAMAEPDPQVSERCLKDLRSEISDTRNENNAIQLHKMMSKARTIFMKLQSRYRERV